MDKITKQVIETSEKVFKSTEQVADRFDEVINETAKTVDNRIEPVRRSVIRRFPTLFLLIVTFGASATFFAIDQIFTRTEIIRDNPWLVLAVGIGTLVLTGRLYKKLE